MNFDIDLNVSSNLGLMIACVAICGAINTQTVLASQAVATELQADAFEVQTDAEGQAAMTSASYRAEFLDGLRARNSRPLTTADARPLRELQRMVNRWDELDLSLMPAVGVLDLLADTDGSICRRVQFTGRVRQCLALRAGEGGAAEAKFQLTVFPSLGQSIMVKGANGKRVAYDRFAVTVRASELPPGMAADLMEGQRIQIDGIHYRFWRYDSVFAAANEIDGQISPLVLAGSIKIVPPPVSRLDEWIVWTVVPVTIGLGALAWWYGRSASLRQRDYDALPDMLPEDWQE